jgi:hypothetical protein
MRPLFTLTCLVLIGLLPATGRAEEPVAAGAYEPPRVSAAPSSGANQWRLGTTGWVPVPLLNYMRDDATYVALTITPGSACSGVCLKLMGSF